MVSGVPGSKQDSPLPQSAVTANGYFSISK